MYSEILDYIICNFTIQGFYFSTASRVSHETNLQISNDPAASPTDVFFLVNALSLDPKQGLLHTRHMYSTVFIFFLFYISSL